MKIQQKSGKVLISSNGCKVEVADTVIISNKEGEITEIAYPGEYEANGVMVQAIPKLESKEVLFFSLDIEGINLVYINPAKGIPTQKQTEQVGFNNIMLIKIDDGIDKVRDFIDLFEPDYVIPLTENVAELDILAKKLGVVLPEKQPVFNVTSELFENNEEELALQLFILD